MSSFLLVNLPFHVKYVDVKHRCSSLLADSTERVVLLSLASCFCSLLPIMHFQCFCNGNFGEKWSHIKAHQCSALHVSASIAFSTKSPESLINVGDLPASSETLRVKNFIKLYVGESMVDTMGLKGTSETRKVLHVPDRHSKHWLWRNIWQNFLVAGSDILAQSSLLFGALNHSQHAVQW